MEYSEASPTINVNFYTRRNNIFAAKNANYQIEEDIVMNTEERKQTFKTLIDSAIREKCSELASKNGKISYNNGKDIVHFVEMMFINYIGVVPVPIKAACSLALISFRPLIQKNTTLFWVSVLIILGFEIFNVGIVIALEYCQHLPLISYMLSCMMACLIYLPKSIIFILLFILSLLFFITAYLIFAHNEVQDVCKFEYTLKYVVNSAIDEFWHEYGDKIHLESRPNVEGIME